MSYELKETTLRRLGKPIIARAIDDDGHGQGFRLTDASLLVLAQDVIQRLSRMAENMPSLGNNKDLDGFCIALLEPTAEEARLILLRAHALGMGHKELCEEYIGGAAVQLGLWWDEDIITFQDMTVAGGRLLHFLRDFRILLKESPEPGRRAALFATVPGEQHILGITMSADVMRDRGWDIDVVIGKTDSELCRIAREGQYPVVGLSASGPDRIRALVRTIVELRIAAPLSRILVSGHIVAMEPEIATRVGADAASDDIGTCAQMLEQLYKKLVVVPPSAP